MSDKDKIADASSSNAKNEINSLSPVDSNSKSVKVSDITMISTKSLSYLFKRDVTKKALEKIVDTMKDLTKESYKLDKLIQDKEFVYNLLFPKVADLSSEVSELSLTLQTKLAFFSIHISYDTLVTIAKNHQQFQSVIQSCIDQYYEQLIKNNSQLAKGAKFSEQQIEQTVDQYAEDIGKDFYDLLNAFSSVQIKTTLLQQKQKELDTLKQELDTLEQQFESLQEKIVDGNKEYQDINTSGFLSSYESSGPQMSLQDLVTNKETIRELQKLISMYQNKDNLELYHIHPPKCILFSGPSETGKTYAAKVFASEINRTMYHIRAHDLFSEEVTDPNKTLSNIFYFIIDHVQKSKWSCIIFLDEIEKIIDSVWEYNPIEQKIISNTIIKNIIAIQKSELDIIVVAALGNKNKIDERLLKNDLFDAQISFDAPESDTIQMIFESYIKKSNVDLDAPMFAITSFDTIIAKLAWSSVAYIKQLIGLCEKEFAYNRLVEKNSSCIIDEAFVLDKHAYLQKKRGKKFLSS